MAGASTNKKKRCSILTNDPRRLAGVDMRSQHGRRFRDIVESLMAEFGEVDTARLRELAALKFGHEAVQAEFISGDVSKADHIVRLSNMIARRERELRLRKVAIESHAPRRSLRERIEAVAVGHPGELPSQRAGYAAGRHSKRMGGRFAANSAASEDEEERSPSLRDYVASKADG